MGYRLGDKWSSNFDSDGMIKVCLKASPLWSVIKWKKLYDSLTDNNYHNLGGMAWNIMQSIEDGENIRLTNKKVNEFIDLAKQYHSEDKEELMLDESLLKEEETLGRTQQRIVDLIKKNPDITFLQLCKEFGFNSVERKIVDLLYELERKGILNIDRKSDTPLSIAKEEESTSSGMDLKMWEQLLNDFNSFEPEKFLKGNMEVTGHFPDISVSKEYKNLGVWDHDEEDAYYREEEGDMDWREDDDNMIWTSEQFYKDKFKTWASQHDWYNHVKLIVAASEKSWCEFYIEVSHNKNTLN